MNGGAILQLVEQMARLAGAGKARKTRAASADAPGRDRNAEGHDASCQRVNVNAPPCKRARECRIILIKRGLSRRILALEKILADGKAGHAHLPMTGGSPRKRLRIAGINIENVAGRLGGKIARKEIDALGDVL